MKKFENIKSITGKVKFKGEGLINGDSTEQKETLYRLGFIDGSFVRYKNMSFNKKDFFTENGENMFRYKVSAGSIRSAIFKDTMSQWNEGIAEIPYVLFNAIAKPELILRGFVFNPSKDEKLDYMPFGFKKKSPFCIGNAFATDSNKMVNLEIRTRGGFKFGTEKRDGDDDKTKSGNNMFYVENVGCHEYESNFFADFTEAQFISLDEVYDRAAAYLEGDYEKLFLESLRRNFGVSEVPNKGAFYIPDAVMGEECAEEGILFTHEMVDKLFKLLLTNITKIFINHPAEGGMFKFEGMELTVNFADGSEENITISSPKDVNDYFFGYSQKYFEASEESLNNHKELIKKINAHKEKKVKNTRSTSKNKNTKKEEEE